MEVVVHGCGPSSSVPSMCCVLRNNCVVCLEAHANPDSKNRRLNPSLLVRNLKTDTNVLIDCGKTFREAALRIFPQLGVSAIHSLILTHGHADALMGMDDLREVPDQNLDPVTKLPSKLPPEPMKVHCAESTSHAVVAKFRYLIGTGVRAPKPFRANLQIEVFNAWEPFEACGFKFLPFPVIHGAGYISAGFEFGYEVGARFVYISDVSEFPDDTRAFLNDKSKPPIEVLLIDALFIKKYNRTHMNLEKVVEEISTICPKYTLLTGMSHEFDYPRHSVDIQKLGKERGLNIVMTYDGLRMTFPGLARQA